ncbi:helix-turn-helix domain-containing transcriptional regulator [Limnofasciculus baicalensis]|uniref:Transcriptional regulator n=1 Tax=Limnofasciculus baicalensis BBK-W-15 TaxID=2699891 RepID=A0AAE3GVR7_9CYAN|nr:transcriptional regulator [Limnofasciculus baicalensis]MCP2731545.1 transcriptional regulator [Limnofasciculus baicalensis BBK-W-15]
MPKSLPYHDFLILQLKDPSYAAVYLETHFELDEGESPDPELLRLALSHVAEALGSPDKAKIYQKKLDELLSQRGSDVIYNLGTWLQLLGLKLTVAVGDDTQEIVENSPANSEVLV